MKASWLVPQLVEHGAALLGTAMLINAAVTLLAALGIAMLAARAAGSARLAKFILLAPWLRVCWDVLRGAAPDAYVLSEHAGTKGALGSFKVGFGARIVPVVEAHVGMQGGTHWYGYSVGDMLAHGAFRIVGAPAMLAVLAAVLLGGVVLLGRRARVYLQWRTRLRHAEANARGVEVRRLGWRSVRIITLGSDDFGPCTSGLLRPCVWLPSHLDEPRRRAVLEHELGHARDGDVLWFGLAGVLSDIFWFVPGVRWLERQLCDRAEEAADASAVARGVSARLLAQSILEHAARGSVHLQPGLGGAAARIEGRLLALARPIRRKRWQTALRIAGALALTLSVFMSSFGGHF